MILRKDIRAAKVLAFMVFSAVFAVFCHGADDNLSMNLGDPKTLFASGNDHYEKNEYEKAANEYEKIIQMGLKSGPLCYNLANAYFKAGRYGKAVLNYERAERLMPHDADVKANYALARKKVKDKIVPGKGIWAWKPFLEYYNGFTINELAWISSGLFALALAVLFLILTRPSKIVLKAFLFMCVLAFFAGNTFVVCYKNMTADKEAIVIEPRQSVLYGPFDSATKYFTLHEGTAVTILEAKGDWYKIKRADNKVGWVVKKAVEKI